MHSLLKGDNLRPLSPFECLAYLQSVHRDHLYGLESVELHDGPWCLEPTSSAHVQGLNIVGAHKRKGGTPCILAVLKSEYYFAAVCFMSSSGQDPQSFGGKM
jgi:hypothetical protein